jgi:hypothetical protein
MTKEDITNKIMDLEHELVTISLSGKDLTYFSKKYLDLLELKELDYNISTYAST